MTADLAPAAALGAAVDPAAIRARAASENFPVALRVLPRALREDLLAVYDVARWVDELGDAAPGDRLALLDAAEAELHAAFDAEPGHPVTRNLAAALRRRALPREPFLRLIEANRQDQREPVMASWDALRCYCELSANPVGELVLHLLGAADPAAIALSDDVCTALQVLEHCQDVAEDALAGRVYLPATDLAACGCRPQQLTERPAPEALRRVVALEVARARLLLGSGRPLLARLHGWGRLVVAGFVAGGLAGCDALERAGHDPNRRPVKPRRRDVARRLAGLLMRDPLVRADHS
jgi:squalene synthase HpnC